MKSLRTVVQGVTAQLVVSRAYSVPGRMRLSYEPAGPYVIRAVFLAQVTSESNGSWDEIFWLMA
ncbi:hypothetical protein ABZ957_35790 [Streptomyces sp. NPDC046316]|uniref:hypothetical protein n=1 Tax=Streptomyces sp. NPDC046316 TaxID=3154494 RepID=UPI0033D98230